VGLLKRQPGITHQSKNSVEMDRMTTMRGGFRQLFLTICGESKRRIRIGLRGRGSSVGMKAWSRRGEGRARGTPEAPTLRMIHLSLEDEDNFSHRTSLSRLFKHLTTTNSSGALSLEHLASPICHRTDFTPAIGSRWA